MNIISICALSIVATVLILTVKRYNGELAILISISSAVIILLSVIEYVLFSIDTVSEILASANISSEYIMILLKVMGICFVTEFTCDSVKEAGLISLCSNIALAGKILVLITAMPMFKNVLNVVSALSGGETIG